jgi:hypothetical protein
MLYSSTVKKMNEPAPSTTIPLSALPATTLWRITAAMVPLALVSPIPYALPLILTRFSTTDAVPDAGAISIPPPVSPLPLSLIVVSDTLSRDRELVGANLIQRSVKPMMLQCSINNVPTEVTEIPTTPAPKPLIVRLRRITTPPEPAKICIM